MRMLVSSLVLTLFSCSERSQSQKYSGLSPEVPQRFCRDRPIKIRGQMLPIPSRTQECTERCWAAVLTMVGRYYGKNLQECDFAGIRSRSNCCTPNSCTDEACNQPASENQVGDMMNHDLSLLHNFTRRQLTESELQLELSNGRPVVIGFGQNDSAHIALVTGFIIVEQDGEERNIYHLTDPWPQIGVVQWTYNDLLAGPPYDVPLPWRATWFRISPREDGCNERFDPLCGC